MQKLQILKLIAQASPPHQSVPVSLLLLSHRRTAESPNRKPPAREGKEPPPASFSLCTVSLLCQSRVRAIDSSGLGLLIHLDFTARELV